MSEISSKFIHMLATEALVSAEQDANDKTHNGVLILTTFGFVYGKFSKIEPNNMNYTSNIILNAKEKIAEKYLSDGNTIINNGSVIVLENAVVKYSNNMTINMNEIIIFCDDIVAYYPTDLSKLSEQLP